MGRNKKLTKAVRDRMARTGENYTTARTALLAAPPPEPGWLLLDSADLESGAGAVAEDWRTLHVLYEVHKEGRVVDFAGPRPKPFALAPDYRGWMRALVGMRAGGRRRLEVEFARPIWGRCTITAQLVAVQPYVAGRPSELVRGLGRPVGPGDRVRIQYVLRARDQGTVVGSTGPSGLCVTLGAGQLEPDLEHVVVGMAVGGTRAANLPPRDGGVERWVWLDLLDRL